MIVASAAGAAGSLERVQQIASIVSPVLTTLIAASVAFYIARLGARFNERATRRLARQDHFRMIIDVNRILIDRPKLHDSLFSEVKDSLGKPLGYMPEEKDPDLAVQKLSLIHLFLAVFEAAYDFESYLKETKQQAKWPKRDNDYLQAWRKTICQFFAECPDAREALRSEYDRAVWSEGFVEWLGERSKKLKDVLDSKDKSDAQTVGSA